MVYDVMLVFVTVGSTQFDTLVQAVLSKPILRCLSRKGYSCLVVQCGTSDLDYARSVRDAGITFHEEDVQIEIWRFKPSLQTEYERAHLVISHAGSGTILDVLRHGKPLIVVPNPSLLDNHQQELASSLAQRGHLATSSVQDLERTITDFDGSMVVPFPAFNPNRFRDLVDEEMGFL